MRHTQLLRRRLQRRQHDRDLVDLRRPTRLRPILQPGDPIGPVPLLPRNHHRLGHPDHPAAAALTQLLEVTFGPGAVVAEEFGIPGDERVMIFGSWAPGTPDRRALRRKTSTCWWSARSIVLTSTTPRTGLRFASASRSAPSSEPRSSGTTRRTRSSPRSRPRRTPSYSTLRRCWKPDGPLETRPGRVQALLAARDLQKPPAKRPTVSDSWERRPSHWTLQGPPSIPTPTPPSSWRMTQRVRRSPGFSRTKETLAQGEDTRMLDLVGRRHQHGHLRRWQRAAKAALSRLERSTEMVSSAYA